MALSVEWTVGGEGELMHADVVADADVIVCVGGLVEVLASSISFIIFFPFVRSHNTQVIFQQGTWF